MRQRSDVRICLGDARAREAGPFWSILDHLGDSLRTGCPCSLCAEAPNLEGARKRFLRLQVGVRRCPRVVEPSWHTGVCTH